MTSTTSVDRAVAQALVACERGGSSGILTATRDKLKRLFCVEQGYLAYASSNVIEEQFSEVLLRDGRLTGGDLMAARLECDRQQIKLTRLLASTGVVEESTLLAALADHFRGLLFSTLDWPEGQASFVRGQPAIEGELRVRLPCGALLLEYARARPASIDAVRRRIGPAKACLTLPAEPGAALDGIELDSALRHVLASADGSTSIADLVLRSAEEEQTLWRAIYGLLLTGAVELGSARAGEGLVSREDLAARFARSQITDHYGLLDVPPSASEERIREAYYDLARSYHPDRFRVGPLEDLLPQIEVYFAKITEAYNTLSNSKLRAAFDDKRTAEEKIEPEHDTVQLAVANYRLAKSLILKGRFTDAVTSLRNAIGLDDRNALYHLDLGQLLAQNPRFRDQAEQHLITCNRLDPSLVAGYHALGDLYVKIGRPQDALRLFREVLRWDPRHADSREQLRKLGAR